MNEVLTYKKFGNHLLKTEDLDPVYTMLHSYDMDENTLKRWCLAYWCFYHTGVASRIAEAGSTKFHDMMRVAQNKKWPRGKERRHFRGEASNKAIKYLRKCGAPEHIVDTMVEGNSFQEICNNVKKFPLFGSWIAFKIADMKEQVLGIEVDYSDCHLDIYKDPRQGAALIEHGDWKIDIADEQLIKTVNRLIKEFKRYTAPPYHGRKVGIMEVETILCKYKSHFKGHYPLFNDSKEVFEMMEGWGTLAEELQCHVPNQDKW